MENNDIYGEEIVEAILDNPSCIGKQDITKITKIGWAFILIAHPDLIDYYKRSVTKCTKNLFCYLNKNINTFFFT